MEICLPLSMTKAKQCDELSTEAISHIIESAIYQGLNHPATVPNFKVTGLDMEARGREHSMLQPADPRNFLGSIWPYRASGQPCFSCLRILHLYHCAETPFRGSRGSENINVGRSQHVPAQINPDLQGEALVCQDAVFYAERAPADGVISQ